MTLAGPDRAARAPLPERVLRPTAGRVLALAPHPDDEVIGCGGTLALHAAQGDEVSVLVAFDGAAGLGPDAGPRARRAEAVRGGDRLGVARYVFWDYPEGHEPSEVELVGAVRRLAELLRALRPDVVYAPWVGEHHLDHHVLARCARLAAALVGFGGELWGYEVWTPLVPTRVVDVTPVWDAKARALREHASQLARRDLVRAALGLNAQRSLYLSGRARYGEAFRPLGDVEPGDLEVLALAAPAGG